MPSALLNVFVAIALSGPSLSAGSVPGVDQAIATVDLARYPGSNAPSQDAVLPRLEGWYPRLRACAAAERARLGLQEGERLAGAVQVRLLLDPEGGSPMGVDSALPPSFRSRTVLASCVRRVVTSGRFPSFRGPPALISVALDLDADEDCPPVVSSIQWSATTER